MISAKRFAPVIVGLALLAGLALVVKLPRERMGTKVVSKPIGKRLVPHDRIDGEGTQPSYPAEANEFNRAVSTAPTRSLPESAEHPSAAAANPSKGGSRVRRLVTNAVYSNDFDLDPLAPIAREAIGELERMIAEERSDERLIPLLHAYSYLASLRSVNETPGVILKLAREGGAAVRQAAVEVAARIGDQRSIEILIALFHKRGELDHEAPGLMLSAIKASGHTASPVVAEVLNQFLDSSQPEAVIRQTLESVGTIGRGARIQAIESLAASSPSFFVKREARLALEKISILQAPNVPTALLDQVTGMRATGSFMWYDWALDNIVRMRITVHTPALRQLYDQRKSRLDHPRPHCFDVRLLHSIYLLGGQISSEEMALLRGTGRVD